MTFLAPALFILIFLSLIYYTLKLGISPMPTSPAAKRALLSLLPEKVEGDIYELGSGWGHLAFSLAYKYPKNHVIAYELSPFPFLLSWLIAKIFGPSNLTFHRKDFFTQDLSSASLIVVYLFPSAMQKLASQLPEGATVVSNTFFLPGRTPARTLRLNDLYHTQIILYNAVHDKK